MLNFNIAILSFGILQSGLLAFALLKKKQQHRSNIYLMIFLIVVGLQLMFKLISKAWLWEHARTVYMVSYNYGYLIGPLIFLFFRSQRDERIFKRSDWLHFTPFALQTFFTIADEVFGVIYQLPLNMLFPWPSMQVLSMIVYGAAAWKFVSNDNRNLRQFIVVVIAIESIIMFTILFLISNVSTAPDIRVVFILLTAMIYWITYKLLVAPDAFFPQRVVPVLSLTALPVTRYANSGLRKEDAVAIVASLNKMIESDRVLLQPDITLDWVAKKLSVKKHHLSQVINQEFGHSFTELVYNWRLEEAARRLSDPDFQNEKLSAIAFDLGFSSDSVFTTKFKRKFKVPPSVYRSARLEFFNAKTQRG